MLIDANAVSDSSSTIINSSPEDIENELIVFAIATFNKGDCVGLTLSIDGTWCATAILKEKQNIFCANSMPKVCQAKS